MTTNKEWKITMISDTHTKHGLITRDLPGGDILMHSGDIASRGYLYEIENFLEWFNSLNNYKHKIFIAGNHDWGFADEPTKVGELLKKYPSITYLQDDYTIVEDNEKAPIKIYGSPWQPWFHNWAFNAHRGEDIKQHWDKIPSDIDVLITHGPAYGYLDRVNYRGPNLGCEELTKAIDRIKPKIHLCGHIHSGNGYESKDHDNDSRTYFFNASVLNEQYSYGYSPKTLEWNPTTNKMLFDKGF